MKLITAISSGLIKIFLRVIGGFTLLLLTLSSAFALSFDIPSPATKVVGKVQMVHSGPGQTLGSLGQQYDVGYVEMAEANPNLDPDRTLSTGTEVKLPTRFILPNGPRHGIVINLAELRLYYYPSSNHVITIPVGIGREGWETPLGMLTVSKKVMNPTWYPTAAVRADAASQGYKLPLSVPPGPDNPLGKYSLRLGHTTYLIHSTNRPEGVGRRSSAGCMRLFPEDAKLLYKMVSVGTPVYVVNQPYKVAWQNNKLYLEAHMPLQEQLLNDGSESAPLVQALLSVARVKPYHINWEMVKEVAHEQDGVPAVVGVSTDGESNQRYSDDHEDAANDEVSTIVEGQTRSENNYLPQTINMNEAPVVPASEIHSDIVLYSEPVSYSRN